MSAFPFVLIGKKSFISFTTEIKKWAIPAIELEDSKCIYRGEGVHELAKKLFLFSLNFFFILEQNNIVVYILYQLSAYLTFKVILYT